MKKEIITASSATVAHCIVNTITDDKNLHRHPQNKEKMKTLACRLLPTFAVTLALCGCGSLDHRPDSAHSGSVHKTDAAEASIETSREIQPANRVVASTDTSVEPSHTIRPAEQRGHLNLHIFGLSYHPDRQGTKVNHLDNNLNAGLGLGYRLHENARGVTNIEAGFFHDSGRNWAKFAGVGYQFKLGDRWLFGADLLAMNSPTYNKGHSFIAPIPRLTYDFGAVKLNATYIPKVQKYNDFAAYAIYLTIPLN